jgi:hypothetical protein
MHLSIYLSIRPCVLACLSTSWNRVGHKLTFMTSWHCRQLSGYLLVNRVPGNFHIEARSKAHNLNAVRTRALVFCSRLSLAPYGESSSMRHDSWALPC